MTLENLKVSYKKGTDKINDAIDRVFKLSGTKTGFQKFKASMISILLGLLIAGIFIMATGNNFLETYWLMIKGSLHHGNWKVLTVVVGAFVLFGLSVAFSFRTGLFNIGGSGQMLLGGSVAIYIMLKLHSLSSGTIFLAFLIAIIIGFIWASLAGFLKAYFNINEVVSTILLNWIAFYIVQQMFSVGSEFFSGTGGPSSIPLITIGAFPSFVVQYAWLISLITIALVIFIIWFVLSKTVFGYNLKVVGQSVDVAKYAGINTKMKVIISLGISGAIAGLGGGLLYILKFQQVSGMSTLPTYGFDGIVIALLAFNSPIGILATGIFYGILNQGQLIIQFEQQLGNETYQIIIGIIIFFAAISTVFFKFSPIQYLKRYLALSKMELFTESSENKKRLLEEKKLKYKDEVQKYKDETTQNKEELASLKAQYKKDIKEINAKFKEQTAKTKYKDETGKTVIKNNFTTAAMIKHEETIKAKRIAYNNNIAKYGFFIKADAKSLWKSEKKEINGIFKEYADARYEEYLVLKDSLITNKSLIRKRESQLNALEVFKVNLVDAKSKFKARQEQLKSNDKLDKEQLKSRLTRLKRREENSLNRISKKIKFVNKSLINKAEIKDQMKLEDSVNAEILKLSFTNYMKGNK